MSNNDDWFDPEEEEDASSSLRDYDISAVPNDFNVNTILDFVESGVVKIPGFQRHYVWDKKRASKLIESILIGIPIPQIFLYERDRNDFLVIDGQQRLMTLYYFRQGRFPRREVRAELRNVFNERGGIPIEMMHKDELFEPFNLQLKDRFSPENPLHGLNYNTLADLRSSFGLRTMRNIFIRQMSPPDDDSSIFELFSRLNTGGINLTQQEIRTSLYHSPFYELLNRLNVDPRWRRLLGVARADIHMKDAEYLLRGFSMLLGRERYGGSILRHLNLFSKSAKAYKPERLEYLERLFGAFLDACGQLGDNPFRLKTNKFNVTIYESVLVGTCSPAIHRNDAVVPLVTQAKLDALKADPEFLSASEAETGRKTNVDKRLARGVTLMS